MSLINYKLHTKLNKSIAYVIVRITIVFLYRRYAHVPYL